jgi:hypothetical protein
VGRRGKGEGGLGRKKRHEASPRCGFREPFAAEARQPHRARGVGGGGGGEKGRRRIGEEEEA